MTYDPNVIEATAAKRFFIDMLVKDIELIPAIADLVDNSVDGARALQGTGDLNGQWIHILADANMFQITDNSGGIAAQVARKYAFRFGRPAEFHGTKGSVGQFGIGMKRALFKLGEAFEVHSTFEEADNIGDRFTVEVDVPTWAHREDDWSFRFSSLDEDTALTAEEVRGTTIRVDKLHPSVGDDLNDRLVLEELILQLSTRHQRSINAGLEISVNGLQLSSNSPELQYSAEIRPLNESFTVQAAGGEVRVQIVAGTVAFQGKDSEADEGTAQNFTVLSPAGWYVYCNGRLLLAADTTATTGWGSVGAVFHPQYRNFRGYVYMEADDAGLLPWNTTKTAVDRDSYVYREVLSRMKIALAEVQSLINRVKAEKGRQEELEVPTPLMSAFASAPNTLISEIPESSKVMAPEPTPVPRRSKSAPSIQRIQYVVDKNRFDKLAEIFESQNGSELGRQTFDYAFKAEIG